MHRIRGTMAAALATVAAALAVGTSAGAQATDHFTCYKARTTSGTPPFTAIASVAVVDQFRSSTVAVRRPQLLCAPTSKNGEDPSAPTHPDHLEDYEVAPATRFAPVRNRTYVDQFGSHALDVKRPLSLQVPTAKSLSAPPPAPANPAVDHFQCYRVNRARGAAKFTPIAGVTLADQFGTMTVELRRLRRLCVPANKNGEEPGAESHPDHLLCYQVKQTDAPRFQTRTPVFTRNQFGPETLDAITPRELCVPARRLAPPDPTPTPSVTPTINPTAGSTTQAPTATPTAHVLRVGAARRTLNPTAAEAPPDGQVYLGGFGLGATRRSTGVLDSGASTRAFVVDNGVEAIALVEQDNQGTFVAYELTRAQAGTIDIAKMVETLRPGLHADHILIAADHSHAGQDLIGVWGGVPDEYLNFVKAQTAAAIVEAYDTRETATLTVGSLGGIVAGDATSILNSQFDDSSCTAAPTPEDPGHTTQPCTEEGDFPDWDLVDDSIRVLHATRGDGSTIATFVNFAAHSTVMGSSNTLISADWPGPTAEKIEAALGGRAVVMPAANGRTQPDRPPLPAPENLDVYSTTIANLALQAVASAVPVQGDEVRAKKRLIFETADNGGILALSYAGQAGCFVDPSACVPIMRAKTPPWIDGDVIGTVASALRVGNVLFSGTPGEPYPQIAFGIQRAVDAGGPGVSDITHHFIFSLCDDQLGYLIAPAEGKGAAVEKTAVDGNDNALFNVAATIGDHVMCSDIALAIDIGFPGNRVLDARCNAWLSEPDLNPLTLMPNP
jgi:hypothetical protein